jgi:transposase
MRGVPTILDSDSGLRGSVHARAAAEVQPQFKAEVVQMVLETGKPIAEVARDSGINEGTLGNWVNLWRRDNPQPVPDLSPVERARVQKMEDEIRRLRMENEGTAQASVDSVR